jgi:hypothetical protein
MAEILSLSAHDVGTAVLVGASSEALAFLEATTGYPAIAGVSAESLTFSEQSSGIVYQSGVSAEALRFSELTRGTVTIKGTAAERLSFVESARGVMIGRSAELLSFAEHITGTAPIIASRAAEALAFSETIRGYVVEDDTGEVWVINLATGGHARYLGALDGSAQVDAYAITPTNQLGADRAKHVPDVFLHLRIDGEMELTTLTDEQIQRSGYLVSDDGKQGMHRRRIKLARGIRGTNWAFTVANVDGADFTLKSLEVLPVLSQRVQ